MALSRYRASRLSRCSRKAASPGAAASFAAVAGAAISRDRDGGGGGGGRDGDDSLPWSPPWMPVCSLAAAVELGSLCSLSVRFGMFYRVFKGLTGNSRGRIQNHLGLHGALEITGSVQFGRGALGRVEERWGAQNGDG